MQDTLGPRAPIGALKDVESFLTSAQAIKALTLQLNERRARRSQLENALGRLIRKHTDTCAALAKQSPRVAEMWKQTQKELRELAPTDQAAQPNMSNGGL